MGFLSGLFNSKNSIKNGGTGTFFGKIIRSGTAAIPIVGGALSAGLNAAAEVKMANVAAEKAKAEQAAAEALNAAGLSGGVSAGTSSSIRDMATAGYPEVSSTFPNGANPTTLNEVTIRPQMAAQPNVDFNLDWKNGKISTSSGSGVNSDMLLYGVLGLGAIMLLKK